jgi:AcrR family transcriptional regulator
MDATSALTPEKRDQILRGAAAVFAADGYEGASMARIAAVAGVSKGTLYNYFETKAALFTFYVRSECDRNLAHVFDGADHDGDPAAVLRGIGQRMLRMMLSEIGLTIYRVTIAEAAKFPDLAAGFFAAGPARAIGFMAGWLAEETQRGRRSGVRRRTVLCPMSGSACAAPQAGDAAGPAGGRHRPGGGRRGRNVPGDISDRRGGIIGTERSALSRCDRFSSRNGSPLYGNVLASCSRPQACRYTP